MGLVTEVEAMEFRCPFSKDDEFNWYCIGSECMCWRAVKIKTDKYLGYCGIGGKPDYE